MNQQTKNKSQIELIWETPRTAGAVAIGRLNSIDVAALDALLCELMGRTQGEKSVPTVGQIMHANFADIDDGLIVRLSETSAFIMPHGGPRIVARLDVWMHNHGISEMNAAVPANALNDAIHPSQLAYPEARCFREALALSAISNAASSRAIPLLLAQPKRIAAAVARGWVADANSISRAQRLAQLLHPPRIVAVGAANVGKSSLLNAVAGRTVAIAMDFAGTTRDAVAARVELDGLVADWFDTPGIRMTNDPVEVAAQSIAAKLRTGASLILEISAPGQPCPRIDSDVPRIKVCTRIDLDPKCNSAEARAASVRVSGTQRTGLVELACAIRTAIICDEDLSSDEPWIFHPDLIATR
ncbi:MAG: 50S ribosome-binding GTPase [Planctomycetota bacterium]|nr:50S ribosome-binding GTPase [Planctomycetota bacterium]MDA1262454.1 50S ribosome-binding GTPase [Planctomycetota bacterium]